MKVRGEDKAIYRYCWGCATWVFIKQRIYNPLYLFGYSDVYGIKESWESRHGCKDNITA